MKISSEKACSKHRSGSKIRNKLGNPLYAPVLLYKMVQVGNDQEKAQSERKTKVVFKGVHIIIMDMIS